MKKTIYYPPVIRVRRPKTEGGSARVVGALTVDGISSRNPPRTPFGGTLRRQILGEFTASARKLAGKAR